MNNVEKRVPKGPIKFELPLSEEQKAAKQRMLYADVSILTGVAGTSKSFLACQYALDAFFNRECNVISFSRPTVATEDLGSMPGNMEEKYFLWCLPLIDNMYKLVGKEKIDKMIREGDIKFRPLQFVRGVTFDNEIAILDEAQNATADQTLMFLTRLGKNSKVIITGDVNQVDLKQKSKSGLPRLIEIVDKVDGMTHIELTENYRHGIVKEIIKHYNK